MQKQNEGCGCQLCNCEFDRQLDFHRSKHGKEVETHKKVLI